MEYWEDQHSHAVIRSLQTDSSMAEADEEDPPGAGKS